jgi:hypothetical protein
LDDRRLGETAGADAASASTALKPSSAPVMCSQVVLLRARIDCPECGGRTPVYAMLGLPEFETAERPSSMLRRISALPAELDKTVRAFGAGRWRRNKSQAVPGAHWHSHCHRCDARLGEAFVLGPDGPFQPTLYKERRAIASERVPGPFVLDGVQRAPSRQMMAWMDWTQRLSAKRAAS